MSALTAHSNTVAAGVADAAFVAEAGRIRDLVGDQAVLSQSRCVDHLLDLIALTEEPAVRSELVECLRSIRKLSAVEGHVIQSALAVALTAVEVEAAYAQFVLR